MRVLLIENDSAAAQSIELQLKSKGFNVYTTDLGEEGIDLGKLYDYDIILLEIALQDTTGYEVIKVLRRAKVDTPIMAVSRMTSTYEKVTALDLGADDYMTKPFAISELVARIYALVRRSKGQTSQIIATGNIKIDLGTKEVLVCNNLVHLTHKEYCALELLALRKGAMITKEMFLNHLYGGMDEPNLRIVDIFVCKLRKKLVLANEGLNHIETVWGRGYALRQRPVSKLSASKDTQGRNVFIPIIKELV